MHAWPQVISILSWLVDLITFIRNGTMPDPNIEQDPTYQKYEVHTYSSNQMKR